MNHKIAFLFLGIAVLAAYAIETAKENRDLQKHLAREQLKAKLATEEFNFAYQHLMYDDQVKAYELYKNNEAFYKALGGEPVDTRKNN